MAVTAKPGTAPAPDAETALTTGTVLETVARRESPSMAHTITSDIGIALTRGRGCRVWDEEGREYLDLTAGSGVLALGHGHPRVTSAMREQLDTFVHGGWQYGCPARAELAERLAAALPWDDPVLLWCTTGSEAVEAALKVARAATGRRQVVGFLGGYHGKTAGCPDGDRQRRLSARGSRRSRWPACRCRTPPHRATCRPGRPWSRAMTSAGASWNTRTSARPTWPA